jgi:hypothetical protein
MSDRRTSESPCLLCGLGTTKPPFCIECDMTGRSAVACTPFHRGAAVAFGVIALAMWVEREATHQWEIAQLCDNGIHSYGHGDTCVVCGRKDA